MQTVSDIALEALGNPVRRDILRMLRSGPKSVNQIAAAFPISRPAISRHLAQLVAAGLAVSRSEGTRNYYALAGGGFAEAGQWLRSFSPDPAPRPAPPVARRVAAARDTDPYEDLSADLLDVIASEFASK